MPKVLVTPHMLQRAPGPYLDILTAAGLEVVYPPEGVDTLAPGVIGKILSSDKIEGMLASTENLNREVLSKSSLRVIARMGVGFDSVEIPAATDLNIAVTITPGTLEVSVAEQSIAMMLAISRGIISRDKDVRIGNWARAALPRLSGKTFAFYGLGRISRALVPRIRGLGMHVIAYDPYCDANYVAAEKIEVVTSTDELLRRADVLSLHTPCTAETANFINRDNLAKMKPQAILLNTGRGGLVDENALVEAMLGGKLLGAGLDVFQKEPLPLDSPLLSVPNILLATHMGGIDDESQVAASSLAAKCIADCYRGEWPEVCVVNKNVKSTWKW